MTPNQKVAHDDPVEIIVERRQRIASLIRRRKNGVLGRGWVAH
jgi:hypothetical protein